MNVGPALSPDGRWIAFLSERSFLSIDLFVADAVTGAVAAKLTDTAGDPRYSSLQYIDSAGSWDRDGRRLAVGTITGGRAAITIFGWPGGSRQAEVVVEDVDEIYSPTWSPDGRAIAFSGMVGGVTDLFVYELEPRRLRRLTHDAFGDIQPAWEPDGRRIAFVTERFTSDIEKLAFGASRLAIIDADSSVVEPVSTFSAGKQVSPHWSPDGRRLHFVSDHDGTSDVYSVDLENGELERLTRMTTGVSGISALSPAISVARDGALTFTVFRQGRIAIHRLESPCGEPVSAAAPSAAQHLPPVDSGAKKDRFYADDALPAPAALAPVVQYRARLSLDRVTDVAFGVGASRLGATVGTGLGIAFSDILNTHRLIAAVQVDQGTSMSDVAAYGAYLNQARRWNWGVIGSSIPSYVGVQA
jgi:dipeptidyl aminopeptidase/acylaminoacyl peptidase